MLWCMVESRVSDEVVGRGTVVVERFRLAQVRLVSSGVSLLVDDCVVLGEGWVSGFVDGVEFLWPSSEVVEVRKVRG